MSLSKLLKFAGINRSKYYQWKDRYKQKNMHNGKQPRDFWITDEEKNAVLNYYSKHSKEGYRAMTYMMIDDNIAYMSCSSVYRILCEAGVMRRKGCRKSKKGNGFDQPIQAHEHWHTDISYIKIAERFYFFIGVLDGYSRNLLHWEIREAMTEYDAEIVLQRALEQFPNAKPRIITDNGAQYTAHEFKQFIGINGLTHVRTSPYYPQSNGKIERFHFTLKDEVIRPSALLTVEDARRLVSKYVEYYNNTRLHSAIGFVTPKDRLEGRDGVIQQERKKKLDIARVKRLEMFAKAS